MIARPDREAGFTLIEVLVAIALLALISSALIETEQLSLDATRRVHDRTRALAQASSLLAEREAGARRDGRGRLADGTGFSITSRMRADLIRPGAPLVPVELSVQIEGRGTTRLSTFTWLDQGAR